jgi:hypothetical protein
MKEFFGFGIVEILQTGFAGVSILLMYMAYQLMAETMRVEKDIERLKVKRTSIFGFMAFSTLVMAGSLYIFITQMEKKEIFVDVTVLPDDTETIKKMRLTFAGRTVKVTENGTAEKISISADDIVTVDIDDLKDDMDDQGEQIATLKASEEALNKDKVALSNQIALFKRQTQEDTLRNEGIVVTESLIEEESGL